MAFGPSHTKTSLLQANPSIHQPAQENPHGEVLELFIQRPQIPTSHLKSTQLPIFFFIPIIPEGSLLQSHTSDGQALFFFFFFFLISSPAQRYLWQTRSHLFSFIAICPCAGAVLQGSICLPQRTLRTLGFLTIDSGMGHCSTSGGGEMG